MPGTVLDRRRPLAVALIAATLSVGAVGADVARPVAAAEARTANPAPAVIGLRLSGDVSAVARPNTLTRVRGTVTVEALLASTEGVMAEFALYSETGRLIGNRLSERTAPFLFQPSRPRVGWNTRALPEGRYVLQVRTIAFGRPGVNPRTTAFGLEIDR